MTEEQDKTLKTGNRFWGVFLDLSKWLVSSVILGIAGVVINKNIQETELEIKRIEADTKLLETVTSNIKNNQTDSLELRYLSFVKTFITTDEIKDEVGIRISELKYNLSLSSKNKVEDENKKETEKATRTFNSDERTKIIQAENDLKNNNRDKVNIEELKSIENKLTTNVTSIDSSTINRINSTQRMIAPVTILKDDYSYKLIGEPVTKWCKEGFYVEFNNTLRIGISSLNNQSIIINLRDIEDKISEPELIKDNIDLSEGESYKLAYNNKEYDIKLSYIGSAGKNPFTKAAFLTVSTYIKQLNK